LLYNADKKNRVHHNCQTRGLAIKSTMGDLEMGQQSQYDAAHLNETHPPANFNLANFSSEGSIYEPEAKAHGEDVKEKSPTKE
jgi:hypothetical protein